MNGKIQVTLLFIYILGKKEWLENFKVFSEEVIVMRSEKIKDKIRKGVAVKFFFCKLASWQSPISLRINFFTHNFQATATSRSCTNCFKSTCEIVSFF